MRKISDEYRSWSELLEEEEEEDEPTPTAHNIPNPSFNWSQFESEQPIRGTGVGYTFRADTDSYHFGEPLDISDLFTTGFTATSTVDSLNILGSIKKEGKTMAKCYFCRKLLRGIYKVLVLNKREYHTCNDCEYIHKIMHNEYLAGRANVIRNIYTLVAERSRNYDKLIVKTVTAPKQVKKPVKKKRASRLRKAP